MAMTQSPRRASALLPDESPFTGAISVLHVAPDSTGGGHVTSPLERQEEFTVETVTSPGTVPGHLDTADCVVSDGYASTEALADLLATVREHDQRLPFVLVAADPPPSVLEALVDAPWTDCFGHAGEGPAGSLLARRLQTLVGHRRLAAVARHSLSALEQGTDAVAIVDPDGTVEFANPLFARQFRASPPDLVGRNWRELYDDAEVERLESDAFPSLADGWRWIGDCEARREDGTTFLTQTRIDALDDGSLVFTISEGNAGSD